MTTPYDDMLKAVKGNYYKSKDNKIVQVFDFGIQSFRLFDLEKHEIISMNSQQFLYEYEKVSELEVKAIEQSRLRISC